MESRLIDLEVRYMHLEQQVADLSGVLFEQQKVIEALKQQLGALRATLGAMGDPILNEKPPHY